MVSLVFSVVIFEIRHIFLLERNYKQVQINHKECLNSEQMAHFTLFNESGTGYTDTGYKYFSIILHQKGLKANT